MLGLWLVVALVVTAEAATKLRGVAPGDASKYEGATFSCFDGSKSMPRSRVNDDYCDCADGSDEPGTSACARGSFFCANRGHESKRIHSAQVDDGVCDCCDGSDESSLPCGNTCREQGEKTRQERAKQAEEVRTALTVRQTYLDKARAELPTKRSRREELQGRMATEDSVLEAVNLKKIGAEKEWRAANDEKEWREKQREKQRVKEDSGFDDGDDKDEDLDDDDKEEGGEGAKTEEAAATKAPEVPEATTGSGETSTATATEAPTDPPRERTVYSDMSDEELERRVTELKSALDEASKVHQDQVAVKDELKKELDQLDELFKHNFVGEHQLYGIFGQCFQKQITEYNYNLCWMDRVEQSGTLLGKFVNYKREGAELVMQYEGGVRCWGGDARSATVRVSCGASNEIVSVTEPNRCQYLVAFKSPTACTPALLQQLEEQIERDNALLNEEETNVI